MGSRLWAWSAETGKLLCQSDQANAVVQAAWSPDGKQLATVEQGLKGAVRTWDAETGKVLHEVTFRGTGLAWSPDGKALAATPLGHGECLVIDAASGAIRVKTRPGAGQNPRWAPDGKSFITAAHDALRLWDAASGEQQRAVPLEWLPRGWSLAAWSPDGRVLALGNGLQVNLHSGDSLPLGVLLPSDTFAHLALTPDGHYRGTARLERQARVVVQRRDGTSETLTLPAFEKRYGWKNDPDKVSLGE
jgi:WD40 repeat protein